jgi:hypothetical protein
MQINPCFRGPNHFFAQHRDQIKHSHSQQRNANYQGHEVTTNNERRRRTPYQPGATPQELRSTEDKGL